MSLQQRTFHHTFSCRSNAIALILSCVFHLCSLRLGKWWKKYGYSGPAYCQRCSELFRDHIIRSLSNSAQCSMASPCLDCKRVLVHFLDGVKTSKKP